MANPVIKVHSADGTIQTLDANNPLAVQTVTGSGVDVDAADLIWATGTTAAAGQTQLIAAPGAGVRIVVNVFFIQNESATSTTLILQAGGAGAIRFLGQNQGDGLAGSFAAGREWKLPANTALNLWLSGANSCGYSIHYYTEAV